MALPTVSALVPVYDGATFLEEALESALDQDYPAGRLEVVVVDDGSRDASAEVAAKVAARHPGRVRVLRQANAGTAAAVNAARGAADGELLALLDADDRWPRDKLRRQVAALGDAGLVYGDMTVIDAAGEVVRESWLDLVWPGRPPSGRCFGALLAANPATASSILLRADLPLGDIPAHLRCADWWLALAASRLAPVVYTPVPRTLYRFHGANIGLGTEGAKLGRAHVRRMHVQRWFLSRVTAQEATPLELAQAWNAFERNVLEAHRHLGPFETIVAVSGADRANAAAHAAAAARAVDPAEAMAACVRALAADPYDEGAQEALAAAWERAQ